MPSAELLFRVVIAALASYRAARMVAMEDGPFDLFSRLRDRVDPKQDTWIGRGINCPLCVGMYTSLVMFGLTYVDYVFYAVVGLAVAGLQVALQRQERE